MKNIWIIIVCFILISLTLVIIIKELERTEFNFKDDHYITSSLSIENSKENGVFIEDFTLCPMTITDSKNRYIEISEVFVEYQYSLKKDHSIIKLNTYQIVIVFKTELPLEYGDKWFLTIEDERFYWCSKKTVKAIIENKKISGRTINLKKSDLNNEIYMLNLKIQSL